MRPEVRDLLLRWREALVGLGVAGIGLYWALTSFGPLQWLGWVMTLGGSALVYAGVQRGRLRRRGDGPGVVTVRERRIAYMGPDAGGIADLDFLTRLELHGDGPSWVLFAQDGTRLRIPADAKGADQLVDLFAALPGLRLDRLAQVMSDPPPGVQVIWQSEQHLPTSRLH